MIRSATARWLMSLRHPWITGDTARAQQKPNSVDRYVRVLCIFEVLVQDLGNGGFDRSGLGWGHHALSEEMGRA